MVKECSSNAGEWSCLAPSNGFGPWVRPRDMPRGRIRNRSFIVFHFRVVVVVGMGWVCLNTAEHNFVELRISDVLNRHRFSETESAPCEFSISSIFETRADSLPDETSFASSGVEGRRSSRVNSDSKHQQISGVRGTFSVFQIV